jgi:flagellar biosynthesis chaperone FliJ
MEPTSSNGVSTSASQMLDALRPVIEQLEAQLAQLKQENTQLRAERDECRKIIFDHLKKQYSDPKEWDDFNEKDYTLTISDLLSVFK